MSKKLLQQYRSIRKNTDQNFKTIRELVEQADMLSEAIDEITDGGFQLKFANKKILQEKIELLNEAIAKVIENNGDLFVEYEKFSKTALGFWAGR